MKKVLIISFFYPPCNLTAAQRVQSWVKYLPEYGYKPVVVTRNWDIAVKTPEDILFSSGNELKKIITDHSEIYYLPYKANLRDKLYTKHKKNYFLQKISKLLTLKELLFDFYYLKSISYYNLYSFSKHLIKNDSSIQLVIISGNPFLQFKFGYLLNKKLRIKWIADYRDAWSTQQLLSSNSFFKKIITKIHAFSEKKWVQSAECITSVSEKYTTTISNFVKKKGHVIYNGYDEILNNNNNKTVATEYNITYNGTLYPSQNIEPFLDAIKKIITNSEITLKINIFFPGLAFDSKQKKRIEEYMKGFEANLFISGRLPFNEVIEIQRKSDLLLMIAYGDLKGIPSSKLYEYIGLKKNILLFPNDHDIIEQTLNNTGLGIICNNEKEIYPKLIELIRNKQNNKIVTPKIDLNTIEIYSRKKQVENLAQIFNSIIS